MAHKQVTWFRTAGTVAAQVALLLAVVLLFVAISLGSAWACIDLLGFSTEATVVVMVLMAIGLGFLFERFG